MRPIVFVLTLIFSTLAVAHAEDTQMADETFHAQWAKQQQLLDRAADTPRRVIPLDVSVPPRVSLSFPAFIDTLRQSDVVLIGEEHDDPASHRLELDIVNSLLDTNSRCERKLTVAAEMFERDVQPALDAYARSPIDGSAEQQFLAASRPWSNYLTDYRPVVELLRLSGIVFNASNTPTPIARRVAKEGLEPTLSSLKGDERYWVAASTTSPRDEYWQRFLESMGGGGSASAQAHGMGMSEEQIFGFYQAQCLKDDTMAESIARLRDADPERQVVHLSGSFHIDYHLGIYPRLKQRRPEDNIVTVALRPVPNFDEATLKDALDAEPGVADYVVFVLREEPPAGSE